MPNLKDAFGRAPASFNAFVEDTLRNRRMEEEKPMKMKKISMTLVFVLVALLIAMACTAIAAMAYRRSAQFEATAVARGLLQETYGIQPDWIRAFHEVVTQDAQGYTVEYTPQKMNELGEYTVSVPTSGTPTVTWSYDGTDLADIAAKGFASDVWGAKQLEEWLALWDEYVDRTYAMRREKNPHEQYPNMMTQEDWVELDSLFAEAGITPGRMLHVGERREKDLTPEQAERLARLAIKRKYGVGEEALRGHDVLMQFGFVSNDDQALYEFWFHHPNDPERNDTEGTYRVAVFSPSGNIEQCWRSISPEYNTLPEGPLNRYGEAVEAFVQTGAYDLLPAKEKTEIATRIHEAGFGELIGDIPPYVPQEDAETEKGPAVEAARAALREKYGLTDEMLALFDVKTGFTLEDGQKAWVVTYAPDEDFCLVISVAATDKLGTYRVAVSDTSGETISVTWSNDGVPVAETYYTETTWGEAPAWDARILPWFIPFEKTVSELEAQWTKVSGREMSEEEKNDPNWWYQGNILYMESWAEINGAFRDAGFDRTQYGMGLPGEGDISMDEAFAIAKEVLVAEYALSRKDAEKYTYSSVFIVGDPGKPFWSFLVQSSEIGLYKTYDVVIDGRTGEVRSVFVNDQIGNG